MRVNEELEDVIAVINATDNDAENNETHKDHKDEEHNNGH